MRIKNTLKNSLYGICSYVILSALGILTRRVFLQTLSVEILGYEGLFGSIFALISLADLGMESVILYRLFPAFAKDDKNEICRVMGAYKFLYRIVGLIVLGIGLLLLPFLRFLIAEGEYNWSFVYAIYLIQLLMTLSSYFLAYKRILFRVSQQEYECTKVDTVGSLVFGALRLVSLLLLKSYYLFLLCNLLSNLACNLIISGKTDKAFPYCNTKQKVSLKDVKELRIWGDIKNNLVQNICGVIYGGTDSIVITAMLGISNVGLLANYNMLNGYVQKVLDSLLNPLSMSIGNYVYSENAEDGLRLFRMFDFFSFCIAGIVVSAFFCLLNPVIIILFGEQYLLSQGFVAAFCVNQYINWNHHLLCFYRSALGRYELDKIPVVIAAALNIILSFVLSKPLGMAGIMLGTAIGHLGFWFGRVRVVYALYIKERKTKYACRQIIRLSCCILEVLLANVLCGGLPGTVLGLGMRFIIAISIPTLLNTGLFWNTEEMRSLLSYLKKIKTIAAEKKKEVIRGKT